MWAVGVYRIFDIHYTLDKDFSASAVGEFIVLFGGAFTIAVFGYFLTTRPMMARKLHEWLVVVSFIGALAVKFSVVNGGFQSFTMFPMLSNASPPRIAVTVASASCTHLRTLPL